MASPHAVDTREPEAVRRHTVDVFKRLGWGSSEALLTRLFDDVTKMFTGRWPGYRAIDMRYHDYEHTLQATLCLVDMIEGRQIAGAKPEVSQRDAELSVMSVLLHDVGFLRTKDDKGGTGAKYTFIHESRSCDHARTFLPSLGVAGPEIDEVCTAIGCTGPRNRISDHTFRRPEAHAMACILVTADYLSQMSAPNYVQKLNTLYSEFKEAFDTAGVPAEKRPYHSVPELLSKTPDFWEKFVRPMLENEAGAMYRYLSRANGANSYIEAVEANIAEVRRRLSAGKGETVLK
jgi:hypothetical protein